MVSNFQRKKHARFFSIYGQADSNVDLYEVWVAKGDSSTGYLFQELRGDELILKEWDERELAYLPTTTLSLSDIAAEQVSGIHYYKGSRIYFLGLKDLEDKSRLWKRILANLQRSIQSYSQKRYNQEQHRINDRMAVLEYIIELYLNSGEKHKAVRKDQLAAEIHSPKWRKHPDSLRMLAELDLVLSSFVLSGDLVKAGDAGYCPTGKALTTQMEHRLQSQRHNENARLQRVMLVATVLSALAAIGSAIAAFMSLKNNVN